MNPESQINAFNNLKILNKLFKKHNIQYWLDAGTLLCAYRDGNLLYEHDTDIGTFVENFHKINSIIPRLMKIIKIPVSNFVIGGINPIYTSFGKDNEIIHHDTIYWYSVPNTNYKLCWGIDSCFSVPSYFFDEFTEICFKELDEKIKFPVPSKTKEYLEYYFGKEEWKKPITSKEYEIQRKNKIFEINKDTPEILKFKNDLLSCKYDSRFLWHQ